MTAPRTLAVGMIVTGEIAGAYNRMAEAAEIQVTLGADRAREIARALAVTADGLDLSHTERLAVTQAITRALAAAGG